jgi:small multidrug resistance family-3 protein
VLLRRVKPLRAALLFAVAALAEIGGAFLIWRALREGAGLWVGAAGALALVAYGVLASLQPESHFGRVLAAYGGVFVCGSLLWGVAIDGFHPDRFDLIGAATCLIGAGMIIWAPR